MTAFMPKSSLKRKRNMRNNVLTYEDEDENAQQNKFKIANQNKTGVPNFTCSAYYRGKIFDFQLSQVFDVAHYAVLFFCDYDFTPQSENDMKHIEENYSSFENREAFPIVITQDRADIHRIYASPKSTRNSLPFQPSFLMASDSVDRLISRAFKSINPTTSEIQRTVFIINNELQVLFKYSLDSNNKNSFPIKDMLNCFGQ